MLKTVGETNSVVIKVAENSPAATAGLKVDDVLLSGSYFAPEGPGGGNVAPRSSVFNSTQDALLFISGAVTAKQAGNLTGDEFWLTVRGKDGVERKVKVAL